MLFYLSLKVSANSRATKFFDNCEGNILATFRQVGQINYFFNFNTASKHYSQ